MNDVFRQMKIEKANIEWMVCLLSSARRLMASCLLLVIIFILSGCIKDDKTQTCEHIKQIEIRTSIETKRITENDFENGDRIGIYAAISPGIPAPDNYGNNVSYTYDGIRWTVSGGLSFPWPGNDNSLDVYAYWPYDAELTAENPAAYNFTIKTDQTSREKYLSNDFLWTRSLAALPTEPIPLLFSHQMTRVQINVRTSFDAGVNWPSNANASIVGLSRNTTINLSDGSITPTSANAIPNRDESERVNRDRVYTGSISLEHEVIPREEDDILPMKLETPATGYDVSFAAILMPQAVNSGEQLIRITLDDDNYVFIPEESFSFVQGETLMINLTLVNQPPGLILDLNQIDWDQSKVWNVYDGNTIVAQVCREYIQGTSAYDVQAVVVYLANENGPSFSSGFAARIFEGNKNASGDYDIDTRSIHGGSVNFTSGELYQQGILPPARKVAIEAGVGIHAASNNAIARLTLQPVTVTDYDENSYPIVKINQWYWMASNLITTRYMNGNSLTSYSYNNNAANKPIYGSLYSGYVASEPQPFLPSPWHVPLVSEYQSMFNYIQPNAAVKIKANRLWSTLDYTDDKTGFGMLPGGYRNSSGVYSSLGNAAYLWTDTAASFELSYYTFNTNSLEPALEEVSFSQAMSLRLVLTVPSATTVSVAK